jgi:thioredoxin reductase
MINKIDERHDVIIVGAGPAGLGIAIVLEQLGLNYLILEKNKIGSSFRKWPKETRFISPSFTGNFFMMPDLNAISPETSPAFELLTEHPTGNEYADHLENVASFYELAIETNITVENIEKKDNSFLVQTNTKSFKSKFVIWAAGEYQFPKTNAFEGEYLCNHYSDVKSFSDIKGKDTVVIGAYESGFDAAINLVKSGKSVHLIDDFKYLDWVESDSSYSLAPFTRDRIQEVIEKDFFYVKETTVEKVTFHEGVYTITTNTGRTFTTENRPLNCTGFDTSLKLVKNLFDFEDNYPLLTEFDESRKTENLFLVGPQVKHGTALFCFIYKYRQRFAIVAEEIAKRKNISNEKSDEVLQLYKTSNFYLKDLECCDGACVC